MEKQGELKPPELGQRSSERGRGWGSGRRVFFGTENVSSRNRALRGRCQHHLQGPFTMLLRDTSLIFLLGKRRGPPLGSRLPCACVHSPNHTLGQASWTQVMLKLTCRASYAGTRFHRYGGARCGRRGVCGGGSGLPAGIPGESASSLTPSHHDVLAPIPPDKIRVNMEALQAPHIQHSPWYVFTRQRGPESSRGATVPTCPRGHHSPGSSTFCLHFSCLGD